ncbi:MAG: HupE/UreJ family protein [Opitutia bacterium]
MRVACERTGGYSLPVTFLRSVFLACVAFGAATSWAHPEWKPAYCVGVIEDGRFDLTIKFDIPSYLVGKHPKEATVKELDDLMFDAGRLPAAYAREPAEFRRGVRILADGEEMPVELIAFPNAAEVKAQSARQGEEERYPVLLNAKLRTRIPGDAVRVEIMFPPALGTVLTNLRRGMDSQVVMNVAPGEKGEFIIGEVRLTLGDFLREGFAHVIPDGWDHCLFMLAMFLGAASLGQALTRSLVFTLGHALTLGLVASGLLPPVGDWIEPVIAGTIGAGGYLAWRAGGVARPGTSAPQLLIPLTFGLVHGLGFAAAVTGQLEDWGRTQVVQLLIGFNVGVELAQMAVILAAAALLGLAVRARASGPFLRRAVGGAIALAGFGLMAWRGWESWVG